MIGRRSRFAKLYGLRVDLQRVESALASRGVSTCCTGDDDRLTIAVAGQHDHTEVLQLAAAEAGLPPAAIRTVGVAELPWLPSGKPDYAQVRELSGSSGRGDACDLRALFADVLQIDPAQVGPDSSFVGLGGDSLSYVAMSVRFERALGRLPTDWHRLTLRELTTMSRSRPGFLATMETSVALRAAAIVIIVVSHAGLFDLWGGAHVLLGVAGYNFAKFCLTPAPRTERVRHLRGTITWIAVPTMLFVAVSLALTEHFQVTDVVLLNELVGPHERPTDANLWFVEVLIYILVVLALLCSIPAVDRWERRWPFAIAAAALAVLLTLRYDPIGFEHWPYEPYSPLALWFFALGWAAAKAHTGWQRLAVTVVLIVGLWGYFDDSQREALIMVGLLALIWVPVIRCPRALSGVTGLVAGASLYTYLTHWHIYPLFDNTLIGVVVSLVVGAVTTHLIVLVRRRIPKSTALTATPAR